MAGQGIPTNPAGVNKTDRGSGDGKNPGGSGHVPVGTGPNKGGVTPSQDATGTAGKPPSKG